MVIADEYNQTINELCISMDIVYFDVTSNANMRKWECQSTELSPILVRAVSGNAPAYIMFTSGSTGIPKGVLICQKSLLNFIEWSKETYSLNTNDILTNVNPIYFDNSVFDFYCSIFNGVSMLAIPKKIIERPKEMLQLISETNCTIWFSVPSMLIYLTNMKLLNKEILKNIRIFSFGGEGYPKELLRKLYKLYGDKAEFFNVYGPTEGTCICSAYKVKEQDIKEEGLVPLGKIASNFDYLILDENGKEASFGELNLLGEQLALGYYNDQERTKQSFVNYDGHETYEEKMYKTGDLVEDIGGVLYFRGRVDNQIKHMGYRIELEEIENAIIKVDAIKQCAVVHAFSKNKFSQIIAFVATESDISEQYLRTEIKKYIPNYMIPNKIIFMKELPKNVNGKVDRNNLKQMSTYL